MILIISQFTEFLFLVMSNIIGFLAYLIFDLDVYLVTLSIAFFAGILHFWHYKKYKGIKTHKENKMHVAASVLNVTFFLILSLTDILKIGYSYSIIALVSLYVITTLKNCSCENDEEMNVIFKFFSSIYQSI